MYLGTGHLLLGRGDLQNGGGGQVKFYSNERGGGADKVLATFKGGCKQFPPFKKNWVGGKESFTLS